MRSSLRVAALQLNGQPEAEANLRALEALLDRAAQAEVEVAVLPENLLCMGRREEDKFASADRPGQWLWRDRVLALGRERGIALVAGSLFVHDEVQERPRVYSRCWVSAADGELLGHYDKRHLFDVQAAAGESYLESRTIAPGSNGPVVIDCAGARWGLSVCYDLRFAEHYAGLRAQGAQVLTVPAAFTHTTGQAHWEVLLRARAIETQCFVVAPNQCGTHASGRRTWGHSLIIDPWGRILAQAGEEGGIIWADLNLAEQDELRQRFPVHEHRLGS